MSASDLALYLLRYVPARDRTYALRQAMAQLDAEGCHAEVAVCAGLLRDVEALRPRFDLLAVDDPARTWDGEGEG